MQSVPPQEEDESKPEDPVSTIGKFRNSVEDQL